MSNQNTCTWMVNTTPPVQLCIKTPQKSEHAISRKFVTFQLKLNRFDLRLRHFFWPENIISSSSVKVQASRVINGATEAWRFKSQKTSASNLLTQPLLRKKCGAVERKTLIFIVTMFTQRVECGVRDATPLPSSHPLPLPDGDEETGSGVPPDMETAVAAHTAHTDRVEHWPNVANFPRRVHRECQIPPLWDSWTLCLFFKKKRGGGCKGCRLLEAAHPRFRYTKFAPRSDNENSANTSAIRSRGLIVFFGKLLYEYSSCQTFRY